MYKKTLVSALLAGLALSGAAQATLLDRGGGLIYDNQLDVTWLSDGNYAMTSGYDDNGKMTWDQAMTWATNLVYYDTVRQVTLGDWRLPIFNEMVALNNSWGALPNLSPYAHHNSSFDLFTHIQTSDFYWIGTEHPQQPDMYAWTFFVNDGIQRGFSKSYYHYAMALLPGDVAAIPNAPDVPNPAPEPATLMLLGLGLAGLGTMRRRGPLRMPAYLQGRASHFTARKS